MIQMVFSFLFENTSLLLNTTFAARTQQEIQQACMHIWGDGTGRAPARSRGPGQDRKEKIDDDAHMLEDPRTLAKQGPASRPAGRNQWPHFNGAAAAGDANFNKYMRAHMVEQLLSGAGLQDLVLPVTSSVPTLHSTRHAHTLVHYHTMQWRRTKKI